MEQNGFRVEVEDVNNLVPVKQQYKVPAQLQSCHTAIVDGYVIEGHVPVAEVNRLLEERPDIIGLAVPGMPIGSPGMEAPGQRDQPYDVLAFNGSGEVAIWASYGQ